MTRLRIALEVVHAAAIIARELAILGRDVARDLIRARTGRPL